MGEAQSHLSMLPKPLSAFLFLRSRGFQKTKEKEGKKRLREEQSSPCGRTNTWLSSLWSQANWDEELDDNLSPRLAYYESRITDPGTTCAVLNAYRKVCIVIQQAPRNISTPRSHDNDQEWLWTYLWIHTWPKGRTARSIIGVFSTPFVHFQHIATLER